MSIAPRVSPGLAAVAPINSYLANFPHQFINFKFHETSGLVITDTAGAYNNGAGRTEPFFTNGQLTLNGGSTGIWDNAGVITPNTQLNWVRSTSEAVRAFFDLSTAVEASQLFVFFRHYANQAPSSGQHPVFCHSLNAVGAAADGHGGYGIYFGTDQNLTFAFRETDDAADVLKKPISMTSLYDSYHTFMLVIDGINMVDDEIQLNWWRDGANSVVSSGGIAAAKAPTCSTGAERGFMLLSRDTGATPVYFFGGSPAAADNRLGDLLFVRVEGDLSSQWDAIAARLHSAYWEGASRFER